ASSSTRFLASTFPTSGRTLSPSACWYSSSSSARPASSSSARPSVLSPLRKGLGERMKWWMRIPSELRGLIWTVLALCVLLPIPPFSGIFDDLWVRVLFLVALYATLGMGLNVVVGLARLLDTRFLT